MGIKFHLKIFEKMSFRKFDLLKLDLKSRGVVGEWFKNLRGQKFWKIVYRSQKKDPFKILRNRLSICPFEYVKFPI